MLSNTIKIWTALTALSCMGQIKAYAIDNTDTLLHIKSQEMLTYLNKTMDPCSNFYDYACGNWPTIHPASKSKYETSVFQHTKDELNEKILKILEGSEDPNDSSEIKNVKKFYQSCLSVGNETNTGYKDKLKEAVQEFGKLPLLEGTKWRASRFDWLKTIAEISHRYEVNIILGYKIMVDLEDNNVNRLFISHPDFPLKTLAMYLDEANEVYRQNYMDVIQKNLIQFLEVPTAKARQVAREILDFEIALVKGIQRYTVRGKELHFSTTVEKLHALHQPDLDIKRLLDISLGSIPQGKITVKNPGYQTNLVAIMKRTPKRKVANYIGYNLLVNFLLPIDKGPLKLQEKCLEKTKGHFANILDNRVYTKFNSNETEETVQNIFQELKTTFQLALESGKYDWINETTRQLAVDKLKAMRLEINSYNSNNFTEEYGSLTMIPNDYIENLKAIYSLNALKTRSKLNRKPQAYYDGAGMSFGPRYILTENTIKIPVATLQPQHFWSFAYPRAVSLGRLGFLIAHEMIHGFDDEGRTFDKQGNDRDWWDASSAQEFTDRSICFKDQYNRYGPQGHSLRKNQQQSENIADNGGLRLAYETLSSWQKTNSNITTENLPDFRDFSNNQIFFLSFAQLWCYDILPEIRNIKFSNDIHEPGNLRVIGPLSNLPEFSRDFNCPLGSGMNPVKKCEIF